LIYELDLDILKLYLHRGPSRYELAQSRLSKVYTALLTDTQTYANESIIMPRSRRL